MTHSVSNPTKIGELDKEMETLSASLEALPSAPESPKTTLEILQRERREAHWNAILRYFLDPKEPHGLGSDLLEAVFDRILGSVGFDIDRPGLEDVRVLSETQTQKENRADIVVLKEDEWFLWFELKLGSSEGRNQTTRYVKDDQVVDKEKTDFEQGGAYIFISKGQTSEAEEFIDVRWREISDSIKEILISSEGAYTARAENQLRDFRDAIRSVTGMSNTENEGVQEEKMKIYAEHYDDIAELEDAFEKTRKREQNRWYNRFVEEFEPDGWSEEWNCDDNKMGRIYRQNWWLNEQGEPVNNLGDVHFAIYFQHFIRKPATFREGRFLFRTITPKAASDRYRDIVEGLFNNEYRNEVKAALKDVERDIEYSISGKKNRTKYYYTFDPAKGTEEFYRTLHQAFEDHYEVVDVITEVHNSAVERILEE